MAKHKLTAEQREEVRKDAKEKVAGGKPRAEIVKAISEKYGITPVSARNYLPNGAAGKKPSKKARRKKASKARRSPAGRRPKIGSRLLQVVAKLSESDLRKAVGMKRLWSQREALLGKKHKVERDLRRIDAKVSGLDNRIALIAGR